MSYKLTDDERTFIERMALDLVKTGVEVPTRDDMDAAAKGILKRDEELFTAFVAHRLKGVRLTMSDTLARSIYYATRFERAE